MKQPKIHKKIPAGEWSAVPRSPTLVDYARILRVYGSCRGTSLSRPGATIPRSTVPRTQRKASLGIKFTAPANDDSDAEDDMDSMISVEDQLLALQQYHTQSDATVFGVEQLAAFGREYYVLAVPGKDSSVTSLLSVATDGDQR